MDPLSLMCVLTDENCSLFKGCVNLIVVFENFGLHARQLPF